MYKFFFACATLVCVLAQDTNDTDTSVTNVSIPKVPVKPANASMTVIDQDGGSCQCVPHYACAANKVTNSSMTSPCKENEVCCKVEPKQDSTVRGCGYRNPQGVGVPMHNNNGSNAEFGEFPWVVGLLRHSKDLNVYTGVGAVIHPQVIMTTAHNARTDDALMIRAGEWDVGLYNETLQFQERSVQEIYIHNEFNRKSLKNDIALLRLSRPLHLAEHINMLCLPEANENFDDSKSCVSNGWGKDVFGLQGRYSEIMKKVSQDMVPHARCQSLLQQTRLGPHFKLDGSFVCAGGEEGQDTCQGDGGAPLACPIGNERYKLTGLVTWGIGCGQKDVPGVFTNVPAFRTWVDDKMRDWGFGTSSYTI